MREPPAAGGPSPAVRRGAGPLVAVTLHPRRRPGSPERVVLNRAYATAIVEAGGIPVGIPPLADHRSLLRALGRCDAVCLPGGPDVDPRLYGEDPRHDLGVEADPDLDRCEMAVARWALDADVPVLAICRGVQLLNVVLGGSLWQDLSVQLPDAGDHGGGDGSSAVRHAMEVEPETALGELAGSPQVEVNSRHHQGIRDLGEGLRPAGRAPDGLVEAVDLPGARFAVGVQCHPEELIGSHAWARHLFRAFVSAA